MLLSIFLNIYNLFIILTKALEKIQNIYAKYLIFILKFFIIKSIFLLLKNLLLSIYFFYLKIFLLQISLLLSILY